MTLAWSNPYAQQQSASSALYHVQKRTLKAYQKHLLLQLWASSMANQCDAAKYATSCQWCVTMSHRVLSKAAVAPQACRVQPWSTTASCHSDRTLFPTGTHASKRQECLLKSYRGDCFWPVPDIQTQISLKNKDTEDFSIQWSYLHWCVCKVLLQSRMRQRHSLLRTS